MRLGLGWGMWAPFEWPASFEEQVRVLISFYVLILAEKTARTHNKSLNLTAEHKGDPTVLLKNFVESTKPKSSAFEAATNFRQLEQGDLSLAEYIDKATFLFDQCQYPPEARDWLLRDAVVIGLRSKEAYCKCTEKGSALTLKETIEIGKPQHTRLVTCDHSSKAIHYRYKFRNSKETGSQLQEPTGADSSHKDQVPMLSPIWQDSMIRNKLKSKRESCFNCGVKPHIPKVPLSECDGFFPVVQQNGC